MAGSLEEDAHRVCERLHAKGLLARSDWVATLARSYLSSSSTGARGGVDRETPGPPFPASGTALTEEQIGSAFLRSDLSASALPSLPSDVCTLARGHLEGVHLVEVVEAVNIAEPRKTRTKLAASEHRCLKLLLSDGRASVAAVEYRRIPALSAAALQRGAKLLLCASPEVRRGVLLLQEANVRVVWGGSDARDDTAKASAGSAFAAEGSARETSETSTEKEPEERRRGGAQRGPHSEEGRRQPRTGHLASSGGNANEKCAFVSHRSDSSLGEFSSTRVSESCPDQVRIADTAPRAQAAWVSGVQPPGVEGENFGAGSRTARLMKKQRPAVSSFLGNSETLQTSAQPHCSSAAEIDELADLDLEDLEVLAVSADSSGVRTPQGASAEGAARRRAPEGSGRSPSEKRNSWNHNLETELESDGASLVAEKETDVSPLSLASPSASAPREASCPQKPTSHPEGNLASSPSSSSLSRSSSSSSSFWSSFSDFRPVSVHSDNRQVEAPRPLRLFAAVTAAKFLARRADVLPKHLENDKRPAAGVGCTDTAGVWRLQLSDGAGGATAFVGDADLPRLLLGVSKAQASSLSPRCLASVLSDREEIKRRLLALQGHFLLREEAVPGVSTTVSRAVSRCSVSASLAERREAPGIPRRGREASSRLFVAEFQTSFRQEELCQELEELLEALEASEAPAPSAPKPVDA
uniref:RecQ-mediated genome instability protein 1 n=1 Tax=Toxoplasma gondii COUG TaxID=1074873 RepID=A0A2G8Y8S2_TOXGO|nr:hypothetical protein TGCOUG_234600 [Toxoplasma gondii COUG]